jgi:hypothetical protein
MLVASGDFATRHLQTVVRSAFGASWNEPREPRFAGTTTACLLLAAATQIDEPAARRLAWLQLADCVRSDTVSTIDVAAAVLDATLFGITGLRLATGGGVDEGWLRLRPWLPPDCTEVRLQGLAAEGVRFDLDLSRGAEPGHGELEPAALAIEGDRERLRVRIRIEATATPDVHIVLQCPAIQYVCCLRAGDVFEQSLPIGGER